MPNWLFQLSPSILIDLTKSWSLLYPLDLALVKNDRELLWKFLSPCIPFEQKISVVGSDEQETCKVIMLEGLISFASERVLFHIVEIGSDSIANDIVDQKFQVQRIVHIHPNLENERFSNLVRAASSNRELYLHCWLPSARILRMLTVQHLGIICLKDQLSIAAFHLHSILKYIRRSATLYIGSNQRLLMIFKTKKANKGVVEILEEIDAAMVEQFLADLGEDCKFYMFQMPWTHSDRDAILNMLNTAGVEVHINQLRGAAAIHENLDKLLSYTNMPCITVDCGAVHDIRALYPTQQQEGRYKYHCTESKHEVGTTLCIENRLHLYTFHPIFIRCGTHRYNDRKEEEEEEEEESSGESDADMA